VCKAIEEVFKHYVENRRWVEPFWDGERNVEIEGEVIKLPRNPKIETKIQPTIFVILDIILSEMGISVIKESDEGIGLLDFKCSYTTLEGVLLSIPIEFKVAHHKNLHHGFEKQLPAYLKAMKSSNGIFAVMWFKDEKAEYYSKPNGDVDTFSVEVKEKCDKTSEKLDCNIVLIVIDASIKVSASKIF